MHADGLHFLVKYMDYIGINLLLTNQHVILKVCPLIFAVNTQQVYVILMETSHECVLKNARKPVEMIIKPENRFVWVC